MRKINEIIIHCSDTKAGVDFRAKDIDLWHKERGFACIGYHYVIDLDGHVEIGRPLDQVGAHCKGHNANSIGICYIGGRDKNGNLADTRTFRQNLSMTRLVHSLAVAFCGEIKEVHGHNYYNSKKACPCFDAAAELSGMLNILE